MLRAAHVPGHDSICGLHAHRQRGHEIIQVAGAVDGPGAVEIGVQWPVMEVGAAATGVVALEDFAILALRHPALLAKTAACKGLPRFPGIHRAFSRFCAAPSTVKHWLQSLRQQIGNEETVIVVGQAIKCDHDTTNTPQLRRAELQ